MKLINQPNNYGCGFACIAMIAGKEYQQMEDLYGKQIIGEGITDNVLWYLLSHVGYASRVVLRANHEGEWPIKIGEWDIWRVNGIYGGHYVVRHKNEIYDPAKPETQDVDDYEPWGIIGVCEI